MARKIIEIQDLTKNYDGKVPVKALRRISVSFEEKRFYAIMGPSGSGKSTFLNCIAGLDRISSGSVQIDGEEFSRLKEPVLTKKRRQKIGFVFQSYNLIDSLDLLDNIAVSQKLIGVKPDRQFIDSILKSVGLEEKKKSLPEELSGGQKQRAAIARTLSNKTTDIIIGDEPTGALDQLSGNEVLRLLREAVTIYGKTVIMVTHDPKAASCADEVLFLVDGSLRKRIENPSADSVSHIMTVLEMEAQSK